MLVELNSRLDTDTDTPRLQRAHNVQVLLNTAAVAYYDHDLVALIETVSRSGRSGELGASVIEPRERLWLGRAGQVVLASGSIEQPLIFCNNDRPGVMLASAALKYLRHHAISPGREVVVATNNDSAYAVARELRSAGVHVTTLVDSRDSPPAGLVGEMRS